MRLASLLTACCLASAAWAQDVERGRLLYETHCGGCHYERVHERLKSEIVSKQIAQDRTIHFDDRETAREALRDLGFK